MKIRIYGLKNCDTCRKAKKALPDAQLVDLRDEGLPDDLLDGALAAFGDAVLNTRSTTWRELDQTARQEPPRALLKAHPALMKRPLIVADDAMFLGWKPDVAREVTARYGP